MWQLNLDSTVQIKELMGSKIYQIDNVFEQPRKLERFLFNRASFPVQGDPWTRNQYYYQKERYTDFKDESAPIAVVAEKLCGHQLGNYGAFSTNVESWQDNEYNSYTTHYWFPHLDNGYTCIVYFNHEMTNGTNLYHPDLREEDWFKKLMKDIPKGKNPWIPKEDVELVTELTPAYNRMVLFDGSFFPHGSAVTNSIYFSDQPTSLKPRKNLCFFYYPRNENKKETK